LGGFGEDAAVPEAHHWLGDALRVQRAYGEAAEAYRQSVLAAPQGPLAADSLAKLVTTLRLMNDVERACTLVSQFRRQFPTPSFTARQRVDTEMSLLRCPA
jgi:TolA-binding protein